MTDITVEGLESVLAAFDQIALELRKRQEIAIGLAANEYKNDVQELAPYKTGTYRRSIHVEPFDDGGIPAALVGTDLPYGKRLEFGFVGADRLGRIYNQAAQPHFRPALDMNREKYRDMIAELMLK